MAFLNWSFMYGVVTGTSIYITLKWICDTMNKKRKIVDCKDDCILFSPDICTLKCMHEIYTSHSCNQLSCSACNFKKFLALIKSAKHTLDICVYLISSDEITNIILKAFKRGVFVRIILDKQMADEALNSKMYVFIKEHVPIKVTSVYMMHNKFVIIDRKKLITGSFNWTRQGTLYNYENGIITENEKIVEKFNIFFQNIWATH